MRDPDKTQRFEGLTDALKKSVETPPIKVPPRSEDPPTRDPDWPIK